MKPFSQISLSESEVQSLRESSRIYPYVVDENSVSCVIQQEDKFFRVWISVKFDVDSLIYLEEEQVFQLKVNICSGIGHIQITVDRGIFTRKRLDELKRYGLDINPKYAAKVLRYAMMSEQNAPIKRLSANCGWGGDGTFQGFDDCYIGNMDLSIHQTADDYIPRLNNLIVDSIGCQLILAISLSSALVALLESVLHTGTCIFHCFGDSSQGKTTGMLLAASAWGNPEPGRGTILSWNCTNWAMLSALNGNFGISVCFDESGALGKRDYTNIIYCLSQGIDRARLTKDSQKKTSKQWNTVVLSSGENSLLDSSNQNSGLRARVVEFLNLPITLSAVHSEKVKTFACNNYGILGREWVSVLCSQSLDQLVKVHDEWQEYFLNEVSSNKSIVKRLICILSITMLTAQLAHERLKLSFDISSLSKYLVNHLREIDRDSLSLAQRAYDAILDWIAEHANLIQKQNECYFSGALARMVKPNEIAIRSSAFKKIMFESGFSDTKVVAQALKGAGLLHPEMKDGLQCRIVFGNVKVQTYRIILKTQQCY